MIHQMKGLDKYFKSGQGSKKLLKFFDHKKEANELIRPYKIDHTIKKIISLFIQICDLE